MDKTVLVVEDDPAVRRMLKRMLGIRGYQVMEAANGLEAIRMLSQSTPDAIVVDLLMPIMSGFELVKALRRNAFFCRIPTVVLTGALDDGIGLEAFDGIPVVLKLRLDDLPAALEHAMGQRIAEPDEAASSGIVPLQRT